MHFFHLCRLADIIRSDIALDKQKGCKLANHPDIMLELQREKAASTQLVLLKEQLSNIYSNITITGRRSHTHKNIAHIAYSGLGPVGQAYVHTCMRSNTVQSQWKRSAFRMTNVICKRGMWRWIEGCGCRGE